jgi:hydroxymethylbilane synthase
MLEFGAKRGSAAAESFMVFPSKLDSPVTSTPERIVIATRESRLALWQAEHVRGLLQQLYPACRVELLGMTTRGDQILDRPLAKIGGKGLFVKELETALLDGSADIAVHSMKDVPMTLEPEFALVAIGPREVPLDAFVSNKFERIEDLPPGAVVGTSSLRREAQLRAMYPYLAVSSLRGNLDTRLRKLDEGQYDAIILAAAGLTRLGLGERVRSTLSAESSLPAAGQGALGIEALARRADLAAWLAPLNDFATAACVRAERAVSRALAGSCEVPLGAYGEFANNTLRLRGLVATPDGTRIARAELSGPAADPEALGLSLVADLRAQGADAILAALA